MEPLPVPMTKTDGPFLFPAPSHREPSHAAKLEVVRDLLAALETATIPGQHYLMERTIRLVGEELARAHGELTDRQRRIIAQSMHVLEREGGRLLPDASVFRGRAEILIDVLSVSRGVRRPPDTGT